MAIGEPGLSNGTVHRRSSNHDIFKGKGERKESCGRNNYSQMKIIANSLLPFFLEAIDRTRLPNPHLGPLTVAEFGSSSGQSSIDNVGAVLQRLKERYGREIGQEPEYQVFFQDLPTTDFNMLIKLLNAAVLSNEVAEAVDYFAAAVPGSIYGRLFPHSTLHFAFTTFALNCLSRIPESVSDRRSPAYNGGQTGLHRSSVATMEAYSAQAKEDLGNFLAARAEEMADDGVLCLNFRCRDSENSIPYSTPHEVIGDCIWDDFVDKGIISASKRDSFNPLQYWRSVKDVKEVLEITRQELAMGKKIRLKSKGVSRPKTLGAERLGNLGLGAPFAYWNLGPRLCWTPNAMPAVRVCLCICVVGRLFCRPPKRMHAPFLKMEIEYDSDIRAELAGQGEDINYRL